MLDENDPCVKYNEGDILSITVAPDDHLQGDFIKQKPSERIMEFYQFYSQKMDRLMNVNDRSHFDYWFRVEISEPIGNQVLFPPRLHLHGIIRLNTRYSVLMFLLNVIPDLLIHSRLQINHIIDPTTWIAYCRKQVRYIPKGCATITNHAEEIETWLGAAISGGTKSAEAQENERLRAP